ncbi:MAG: LPS export ABC transporter periplasmic protein LptC, partial [Rhodospirillales bacterium]|nr:LPS export ABC transporter periplasmic protein LptC [Rhodospirillales bacterium]
DTVYGARYRGLDEQTRPDTLRADIARRIDPTHVALTRPTGEMRLSAGSTAMLRAARGVYRDAAHALDLSGDVTLYRSDGTVIITDSAAIDLRRSAAAGSAPVHATGPFGTLSAQGGFTLLDKGGDIQFAGPARLVLDGATK